MSEQRRPFSDPEVLELFQEEPELLAIVDAIHATQAPRRRRVSRPVLVAVSAVAALIVVALIPWQFRGADLTERALAAIGDARVVHLVASRPEQDQVVVDLETGSESAMTLELESWFDTESGKLRTVTRRQGVVVADTFTRKGAGAAAPVDPVVATFVRGYRSALGQGELEVVRRGRLDGDEVVWVRASLPGARRDEVALDATTHLPRAFRLVVGAESEGPLWRVPEIDSRLLSEPDFAPRPPPAGAVAGGIESEQHITLEEAARLLDGKGRWPGREVAGLRLDRVVSQELTRTLADGSVEKGIGLELVYGDTGSGFVEIQQAARPEPAYRFVEGRLTFGFAPIPEGAAALVVPRRPGVDPWLGQLRAGDVFLTIQASGRRLVLDAARSLVALR